MAAIDYAKERMEQDLDDLLEARADFLTSAYDCMQALQKAGASPELGRALTHVVAAAEAGFAQRAQALLAGQSAELQRCEDGARRVA